MWNHIALILDHSKDRLTFSLQPLTVKCRAQHIPVFWMFIELSGIAFSSLIYVVLLSMEIQE